MYEPVPPGSPIPGLEHLFGAKPNLSKTGGHVLPPSSSDMKERRAQSSSSSSSQRRPTMQGKQRAPHAQTKPVNGTHRRTEKQVPRTLHEDSSSLVELILGTVSRQPVVVAYEAAPSLPEVHDMVAEELNDSTVVQGNTFEQQQDTNLDHEEVVAQGSFPDRHAHNHRAASPVSSRPPDGFASKSRLSAAQQAAADERAMKLRKQEELKESLRLQVLERKRVKEEEEQRQKLEEQREEERCRREQEQLKYQFEAEKAARKAAGDSKATGHVPARTPPSLYKRAPAARFLGEEEVNAAGAQEGFHMQEGERTRGDQYVQGEAGGAENWTSVELAGGRGEEGASGGRGGEGSSLVRSDENGSYNDLPKGIARSGAGAGAGAGKGAAARAGERDMLLVGLEPGDLVYLREEGSLELSQEEVKAPDRARGTNMAALAPRNKMALSKALAAARGEKEGRSVRPNPPGRERGVKEEVMGVGVKALRRRRDLRSEQAGGERVYGGGGHGGGGGGGFRANLVDLAPFASK
mmetsp:Transcript_3354/g.8110  ORF Transcript_3354/g.8110 Transcript_3354/m.8110 type:complete len:522 (-) Transcript_3354:628-2193(-)